MTHIRMKHATFALPIRPGSAVHVRNLRRTENWKNLQRQVQCWMRNHCSNLLAIFSWVSGQGPVPSQKGRFSVLVNGMISYYSVGSIFDWKRQIIIPLGFEQDRGFFGWNMFDTTVCKWRSGHNDRTTRYEGKGTEGKAVCISSLSSNLQ